MNDWDTLVCDAVAEAANSIRRLEDQTEVGELAHLQPALAAALRAQLGDRVITGFTGAPLPDWNPLPGGIDVAISNSVPRVGNTPVVGIELKCHKLDETLWDIFKMSALRRLPGVEAAYVVVAAPTHKFESAYAAAELFNTPVGHDKSWETVDFFKKWFKAWGYLLKGGAGRPVRVPQTITLRRICAHGPPAFEEWDVRALRIENSGRTGWLAFGDYGWPSHLEGVTP